MMNEFTQITDLCIENFEKEPKFSFQHEISQLWFSNFKPMIPSNFTGYGKGIGNQRLLSKIMWFGWWWVFNGIYRRSHYAKVNAGLSARSSSLPNSIKQNQLLIPPPLFLN